MEPQIAAVVIEKSLSRPKAGMPASWRKSNREVSKSEKRMKAIKKNWRRVKSFVMDAGSTLQMHLWEASQRPAVRGVALTVLIWLARHSLQSFAVASLDTTRNAVQNFLLSEPSPPEVQQQVPKQTPFSKRSLLSVLEDRPNLAAPAQPHVRRPWWNIGGIFSRGGNSEKVNLKALGQVRKLGFLDSLRVRLDIFKMGL